MLMLRCLIITLLVVLTCLHAVPLGAQQFSSVTPAPFIQEKAYVHLDNNCYYKGDTIWYKAYVVRADNLTFTHMSRILYVELLSPDGMVVERQNHIITPQGMGDGCFALTDSLYSGYYELRAYTRWMLNFGVSSHPHQFTDVRPFYNAQMAEDFFRQYQGLFSRVVPVYERPRIEGDYQQREIFRRPKSRLEADAKPALSVTFYPEGGQLVAGQPCTLAFEATDQDGQAVDVQGQLHVGADHIALSTVHLGRGLCTFTVPDHGQLTASFEYQGRQYDFSLPSIQSSGCALHVTQQAGELTIQAAFGAPTGMPTDACLALLCRGVLLHYAPLDADAQGRATHTIPVGQMPTGVYNVAVCLPDGTPLAERLVFVNNHEYDAAAIAVSHSTAQDLQPLQPVTLQLQTQADVTHLSISVRDRLTSQLTYDTGNMLTDLLLTSDLRGFVADPAYYFQADDVQHQLALDLLMLIQGWRRYDIYTPASTPAPALRYEPEQYMTVEGNVYQMRDFHEFLPEEVASWRNGLFGHTEGDKDDPASADYQAADTPESQSQTNTTGVMVDESVASQSTLPAYTSGADQNYLLRRQNKLREEVTVSCELILTDQVADVELQTTDGGHFVINIPPYFGDAVLFLSARKTDLSPKQQQKLQHRGRLDETAWPDFYVKRDLFYPVYSQPYSYYQTHSPQQDSALIWADQLHLADSSRISTMDRELDDIEVSTRRRRGSRAIDYSKPVFSLDAYQLYNLVTDRGLSYGKLNFEQFPVQIAHTLMGNLDGQGRTPKVQANIYDGEHRDDFYRNYRPMTMASDPSLQLSTMNTSNYQLSRNLFLNRLDQVRVYTDFELRHPDKALLHTDQADVTIDFVLMPNDSQRYSYRDRRLVLPGFHMPATYYNPDYRRCPLPDDARDYRRTLYWAPNAPVDANGQCTITFYNNSTATQLHISVAGLSADGKPIVLEEEITGAE